MSSIEGVVAGGILSRLARYRFLTISQLERLGAGNEKTVRLRLAELETAKLVLRQEFRLGPSAGRLPNVYWLAAKGAKRVADATGRPVEVARPRHLSAAHVWHRMLTVDALIAADRWTAAHERDDLQVTTYMQRQGTKAVTGIEIAGKNAIADAVLRGVDAAGNRRVYVLEIYCSRYSEGRSSFPLEQLEPYVLAGQTDALDNNLGIGESEKAARILVVCDTTELRDRLMRVLPKREGMPGAEAPTWGRFHFKGPDELANFGTGWHLVSGALADLPV